jgi:hypothetical protein
MPLYRRIARKGFSNYPFKKEFIILNLESLERHFSDGDTVSMDTLKEKKLIKKTSPDIKILGKGELTKKLTVEVEKVSKSAREKIEKAGGKVVAGEAETAESPKTEAEAKAKAKAAPAEKKPAAETEAVKEAAEPEEPRKEEVDTKDAQDEVKAEEQDS